MSRFAQTYEDPSYEYQGEDMEEVVEYNEAQGHAVFEHLVRGIEQYVAPQPVIG